ncbi:MAG: nicotinate phosphoribosyltransferase, partial [Bacillota bacterium]|nr:nicotinate phosphoribosyltransferase [Bacillota bacterium]
MSNKDITSVHDIPGFQPERDRLHSATHPEIQHGWTTDVYFAKTLDVLRTLGLEDTVITAEVFCNRSGVVCGIDQVVYLLRDREVRVWGLSEGDEMGEKEVLLRIEGRYSEFGVFETALLGILASSSGWATAARACRKAAGNKRVVSFGARHVHPAVAPVMELAALTGGCDGVSCILAAALAGQEPVGTIPHACFLIAGDTLRVARAYPEAMPPGTPIIVLVDTFKDEVEETLRV